MTTAHRQQRVRLRPGAGHSVTLWIMTGLVLGKFLGVIGASWLALGLGIGQLPAGTRFSQVMGVARLGGIGFTMSIFIAELAFAQNPEFLRMATLGMLAAFLLGGLGGYIWLYPAVSGDPYPVGLKVQARILACQWRAWCNTSASSRVRHSP